MNIHEYQAKALLKEFGVRVPKGGIATSGDEAVRIAQELGGDKWVVKAQIHAGGRGKAGGVKVVSTIEELRKTADEILGMTLITAQTSKEGQKVKKVYIEEACAIEQELYMSLLVDRKSNSVAFIASREGGMDIEELAKNHPEKIITAHIDPVTGMRPFHARNIAYRLGLRGRTDLIKDATKFLLGLFEAFIASDANMIEINPLVVTEGEKLLALDAKMNFDGNALFKHTDILELRDEDEEDPTEFEASQNNLNYIKLDGNIGCMVNGAGLAMATMDIIKTYGASPANFLDVGGSATKERIKKAFEIILSDKNVEGILVNIFGGIMRCDIVAEGIVAAATDLKINVPLVVRLEGTNVELGKQIIADSGLTVTAASDLDDAAIKITAAVKS
ncbi:MAG: ADP-forming succinate--CoA ligase subunit beta [Alphaproteobacteria bacterium]